MEETHIKHILTLNAGSSSIKFALYDLEESLRRKFSGVISRIGLADAKMVVTGLSGDLFREDARVTDMQEAVEYLLSWLNKQDYLQRLTAIGHRIVHGKDHTRPELVTDTLLDELNRITSFDPDHLPGEIGLMKALGKRCPQLPQIACFDTSFHNTISRSASLLPIPRRFDRDGIRRYGFHGLSYSYLMEILARKDAVAAKGKVILAHLGNGASMAAVKDGMSIDTSMGFTPAGGFPMGARSGDLDPGVAAYIMKSESLTADQFSDLINHQSGLLGISEISPDMLDLLNRESVDLRAAEAVSVFCYQVKKWIGSFTAVLGGLDILVFSGGIGENAGQVRSRICAGLEFIGIKLDTQRNEKNAEIISAAGSSVKVYVIPTDEELVIAETVCRVLSL